MSLCKNLLLIINSCIKKPILPKISTIPFQKSKNPRAVFFIKPWDDDVLASFIEMLKYLILLFKIIGTSKAELQ